MPWSPDVQFPPVKSPAERMLRTNWNAQRWRNAAGAPMVSAEFVAESGRRVHIIDVRSRDEIEGPLGYIPGAVWVPIEHVAQIASRLSAQAFVVLVSRGGERAGRLAQYLEMLGMHFVAGLEGGMREWRLKGFITQRDKNLAQHGVDTLKDYRDPLETTPKQVQSGHEAKEKRLLSRDEIHSHIGDPRSVRWIKLAALVVNGKHSCVDGRDDHGVVGTPGGDAGEFLLSLGAIEEATGEQISPETVPSLLDAYIEASGRFYMHSDTHAMNALILKLRARKDLDDLLPPLPGLPEHWRKWSSQPPVEVRNYLKTLLIEPEHIGCGHLRRVLMFPEQYGVRKELTIAFLLASWELLWAGSTDMALSILGGSHDEGAVVNVTLAQSELTAFTRVPLVSPATEQGQMFLNTPQVAQYLRSQMVGFMLEQHDKVPLRSQHTKSYREALDHLAGTQLRETLNALASGLPVYEVRFSNQFRFEVIG